MKRHYDVGPTLTVTVHDDGTVTWSSGSSMSVVDVLQAVYEQKRRRADQWLELRALEDAIRKADGSGPSGSFDHRDTVWHLSSDGRTCSRCGALLGLGDDWMSPRQYKPQDYTYCTR